MKTLERTVYIPVIISETERPKWDPLLFNDPVESNSLQASGVELHSGVSQFTSVFPDKESLDSIRGELDAIIAAEANTETSISNEFSSTNAVDSANSYDVASSDVEGQDTEGFEGENDGSDRYDE